MDMVSPIHDSPSSQSPPLHPLIALARPRHWIKNTFVLAPLLFTGLWHSATAVGAAIAAFAAFCLVASAVYVFNDLVDIERDRAHPAKRLSRPLASGAATPRSARLLLAALLAAAIPLCLVTPDVIAALTLYLAINVAYSLRLKHVAVADLFAVASGFVLRVQAGALALDVPASDWMLITTGCLALYLAALKRKAELASNGADARAVLALYSSRLIERYAELAGTAALLFYGLFVLEARPSLAPTIPLVLFGLFRYWYLVDRHAGGESPTEALLTDTVLLLTVAAWGGACAWYLQHAPMVAP